MRKAVELFAKEHWVYYFALCASLLLSLWIYFRGDIVNPDALCYLLSAEKFGQAGLREAMGMCGQAQWPFYSIVLYYFAKTTSFQMLNAAFTLNAVFSMISVVAFILITKELGGSKRTLWLALLVILCAHQYINLRDSIIRDHGFWTFYLLSVFSLLRFYHRPTWLMALLWSASLIIATLFRIEALFFLAALPFTVLFYIWYPFKKRCQYFLMLNILSIILVGLFVCLCLVRPDITLEKLGRMDEIIYQFQHGISMVTQRFHATQSILEQHVLNIYSARDSKIILMLLLLSWYSAYIITSLSVIYTLLVIYAWRHRLLANLAKESDNIGIWKNRNNENLTVLMSYYVINLLITGIFFLQNYFLSSRYLIAFSLLLMLWVPFALEHLLQKSVSSLRHRFYLIASVILIFISLLGELVIFGNSKDYIPAAGNWLAKNMPQGATLYSNNLRLMYYSKQFGDKLFIEHDRYAATDIVTNNAWRNYDYIALRVNHRKKNNISELLATIKLLPIQVYGNHHGDGVIIYKVH